jgi:hypothetical protein
VQHSALEHVLRHLQVAWRKDHHGASGAPGILWDLLPIWLEDLFGDQTLQHVDELEVDGRPWVLSIVADKLHLLRVAEQDLEVIYLGALPGGVYREIIGDRLRIEFSHPRLEQLKIEGPVVVEGSRDSEPLRTVRPPFRAWGRRPPSDPHHHRADATRAERLRGRVRVGCPRPRGAWAHGSHTTPRLRHAASLEWRPRFVRLTWWPYTRWISWTTLSGTLSL